MTIVAASAAERLMIADTLLITDGWRSGFSRKIVRGADGSVGGGAGDTTAVRLFLEWVERGRSGHAPEKIWDIDKSAEGLVLTPTGQILFYGGPRPDALYDKVSAIGGGQVACLAASYAGASLRKAVEIACKLSATCGGDLEELAPGEPSPPMRRRRKRPE